MYLGTLFYTWMKGEMVGIDEFGNRYFQNNSDKLHGKVRRWVLYKGKVEASKVPPEWHAWLHHTCDFPLTENAANAPAWHKEHLPNLTGTEGAYRPRGHDLRGGERAHATGDYQSWTPE